VTGVPLRYMNRLQRLVGLSLAARRPEPVTTVAHSVADVLDQHLVFEVESIDRMYLNMWQPRLAYCGAAVHARPLRLADVPAMLADCDLLITATGCPVPVVLAEQVRAARVRAGARPLFVLDLGMPPDVYPAMGRLAGVTLVDLDALPSLMRVTEPVVRQTRCR
jgi:glutamyl-tRNA reductase